VALTRKGEERRLGLKEEQVQKLRKDSSKEKSGVRESSKRGGRGSLIPFRKKNDFEPKCWRLEE